MIKPIVRDPIYRRRVFDAEIIELCVRWYITYRLSYWQRHRETASFSTKGMRPPTRKNDSKNTGTPC